jgi:hypothetical protein
VGRYKAELSPRQIEAVEEIAQYGMLAYGYQPSRWHVSPIMAERRMHLLGAGLRDMTRRVSRFVVGRTIGLGRTGHGRGPRRG